MIKLATLTVIVFIVASVGNVITGYNVDIVYSYNEFDPLGSWIIENDTVYMDDENCYLSVTPHNLTGRGWVTYNLINKRATQDIDIVYGFDIDNIKPKAIQIWKTHTRTFTGWHWIPSNSNISFSDVTGYDNLGIENHENYENVIGTQNNTYLFRVYYDNKTDIVAFDSYWIDPLGTYHLELELDIMSDYTYQDEVTEWVTVNKKPKIVDYNYGGMNKWFLFKNIPVVQDQLYKYRVWMEPKISSGNYKYWYALKPSSETLQQAILNNHFYALDPWGASFTSWTYRKQGWVQADQFTTNMANFPVYVNITDTNLQVNAQSDGDDIVFTASDGDTVLNHEIVTFNSSNGHLIAWVNFTSIDSSTNTSFYMYYGNAGCAAQEDVHNTWHSQFRLIYHFNHSDTKTSGCYDSTVYANHGTYSGSLPTDAYPNGEQYGQYWDGTTDYVTFPLTAGASSQKNGTYMWFWAHEDDSANHVPIRHFDADGSDRCPYSEVRYSDNKIYMNFKWSGTGSNDYQVRNPDSSDTHFFMRYESGAQSWGWQGTTVASIGSLNSATFTSTQRTIGATAAGTSSCKGNFYEVWWSDQLLNKSYVASCYNVLINSSTAVEFGTQEQQQGAATPDTPPYMNNPFPENNTNGWDINLIWNITIWDNDSTFNFTIHTSHGDSHADNNTANGSFSVGLGRLEYSTQYTVWVNVTDYENTSNVTREWFFFTTGANPIVITNLFPGNGSTNVVLQPVTIANYNNTMANTMNITFYYNDTIIGTVSNAVNGTRTQILENVTQQSTTYTWRVTIDDGDGHWINNVYTFTTEGNATGTTIPQRPPNLGLAIFGVVLGSLGVAALFNVRKDKRRY